jgi:hypothetical protein
MYVKGSSDMTALVSAILFIVSCAAQGPATAMAEPPAHHEKNGYKNTAPYEEHGFFDFLRGGSAAGRRKRREYWRTSFPRSSRRSSRRT